MGHRRVVVILKMRVLNHRRRKTKDKLFVFVYKFPHSVLSWENGNDESGYIFNVNPIPAK